MHIEDHLMRLLALPRAEQVPEARALIARLPTSPVPEAWNTHFASGSLFEAWTQTTVARAARAAVAAPVRRAIDEGPGLRIIDVGAGNGALWHEVLVDGDDVELVLVDPVAEAIECVQRRVPRSVRVTPALGFVQDVDLPEADVLVCSMTLHHVAGANAADRRDHGLTGIGKGEILEAFGRALRPRGGIGLLVEADIDCDLDLPSGAPTLAENLLDSYVRRCARGIVEQDLHRQVDADLKARWRALLRYWFLEQIQVADLPIAERDVYELTVPRWLSLLERAGLIVAEHRFTDTLPLFHLYQFRANAP